MYETFFGLKRRPFLFVPDTESYFSVGFMEESRQSVEHAIQKESGISLIFGAAGTGKSLLLRMLRQSLESDYTTVLVSNSRLDTPKALFLQLIHDLHLTCSGNETVELRLQILDFARKSLPIVLLFDEAQHLSSSVLEEIRLLTDSVNDSVPLFHAVLTGTLNFEEKLTSPQLEAFNQRIISRSYLDSFTSEETSQYIARQTDDQQIAPPYGVEIPLFTTTAKRRIHQLTDGIPRLINQLCNTALQFAAAKERENVDENLINDAWASLQHIEPIETEQTDALAVQEPVISPEEIAEIVDQKRKTFKIRQFDPVEFGTLTDSEPEPVGAPPPVANDYKPPYPEDDDEFTELVSVAEDAVLPVCQVLQLHVSTDAHEHIPKLKSQKMATVTIPRCTMVLDFYKLERQFRRRCLLRKIQNRLGLFAGLLQRATTAPSECPQNKSDMNAKSLQEYGAAVLDGRPPFVRKEPQYAYQTPEVPPRYDVTYPDPKTGVPITLRWLPENTEENERFGVSYTEFVNREKCVESNVSEARMVQPKPASTAFDITEAPVVRTSLNASSGNCSVSSHLSGIEELFEESKQVGDSAISLAELFRAQSSALLQMEEIPEFKNLDETIQRQLETVVKRILKAAEKIEQAAEMSEQAGRHVSQAAEFVETEVKSALPVYTDLFRQWSEFQELISTELGAFRQQPVESPKFRTFPRRQVMIERTIPTIDVESLLR